MVVLGYWIDDDFFKTKWEEHLRRVADAVGRPDGADRLVTELDAAVEAFRDDFPGDPADVELSIMKARMDTFILFTPHRSRVRSSSGSGSAGRWRSGRPRPTEPSSPTSVSTKQTATCS